MGQKEGDLFPLLIIAIFYVIGIAILIITH